MRDLLLLLLIGLSVFGAGLTVALLLGVKTLTKRIETFMSRFTDEIADLNTELAGLTDAVTGATTLIDSLLAGVEENASDETALRELVAEYRAQKDALVASTMKGTPAEPAPSGDTQPDVA